MKLECVLLFFLFVSSKVYSDKINFLLLLDGSKQQEEFLQAISDSVDSVNEIYNSTMEVSYSAFETKVTAIIKKIIFFVNTSTMIIYTVSFCFCFECDVEYVLKHLNELSFSVNSTTVLIDTGCASTRALIENLANVHKLILVSLNYGKDSFNFAKKFNNR